MKGWGMAATRFEDRLWAKEENEGSELTDSPEILCNNVGRRWRYGDSPRDTRWECRPVEVSSQSLSDVWYLAGTRFASGQTTDGDKSREDEWME